jgi:hypothetical protein
VPEPQSPPPPGAPGAHAFSARQGIHYAITRGKPADLLGLEEVKRRLKEAVEALAKGDQ